MGVVHLQHGDGLAVHDGQRRPPPRLVVRKAPGEDNERLAVVEGKREWISASVTVETFRKDTDHTPVPRGLVLHFEYRFTRLLPPILLYLSWSGGKNENILTVNISSSCFHFKNLLFRERRTVIRDVFFSCLAWIDYAFDLKRKSLSWKAAGLWVLPRGHTLRCSEQRPF